MALALVTFALRTYINIGTGVFAAGIFTLTTIFLALNFIPKVHTECCNNETTLLQAHLKYSLYP